MGRFSLPCGRHHGRLNKNMEVVMAKNEKTSKTVASKAAKVLRDPKSTEDEKSVAASALTQAADKKKYCKKRVSR